ncbi:MAG: hypothetical protein QG641_120, partial [Candidatus Poribacteria bacterium]|nr:hypothetical protein [Candidatus Poribacteria bacterium]
DCTYTYHKRTSLKLQKKRQVNILTPLSDHFRQLMLNQINFCLINTIVGWVEAMRPNFDSIMLGFVLQPNLLSTKN